MVAPTGQDDGVVAGVDLGRRQDPHVGGAGRAGAAFLPRLNGALDGGVVAAHLGRALEDHTLGLELGQATVEDGLLHFELGDAVAQEPTRALGPLEDRRRRGRPGPAAGRRPGRPAPSRRRPPTCRSAPSAAGA